MRSISDNGLKFTAAFEQFRSAPYFATENERQRGIYTIGFGHTTTKPPGRNITQDEAYALLKDDMTAAVRAVDAVAPASLNQAQFDAMCDLVFNVGPGALYSIVKDQKVYTGTGEALRAGDIATLRVKLPQFRTQQGKVLTGLVRRANGRLALFDGKPWAQAEHIGRTSA